MSWRAWSRVAGSLLRFRRVGYLVVFVTSRCNLRCPFCLLSFQSPSRRSELTPEEFRRVARKLGPLVQLSLTGGEPFLRHDLSEVAGILLQRTRAPFVSVSTNGWFTDRITTFVREVLPRFPDSSFRLVVSIDALGEEHDRLRGRPGTFQRALETSRALLELRRSHFNLVVDANAVVHPLNQDRLKETLETLHRTLGFDNLSLTRARGGISNPSSNPDCPQRYLALVETLRRLRGPQRRRALSSMWRAVAQVTREGVAQVLAGGGLPAPCVAGRNLVVLRQDGEVLPCEMLDCSLGNLLEHAGDLGSLLASSRARALTRWIRRSGCACTYECAMSAGVVWNPRRWPRVLRVLPGQVGEGGP